MASVNAPRGLQLAKKNGDGSNSTGIRTIDLNVQVLLWLLHYYLQTYLQETQ